MSEVTDEVRQAHQDLLASFAAFMEAFGKANELGIDAGTAISQSLRASMSAEDWDAMPMPVKMLLG